MHREHRNWYGVDTSEATRATLTMTKTRYVVVEIIPALRIPTPTPTPTPTPATLTITADHPITELQPGDALKFAVANGTLKDVKVTDSEGSEVTGTLKDAVWTPSKPWSLKTT